MRVHELREVGAVMADDNVKVTATLVDHPPVVPAFAYRFDASGRSIVISGDTAPSQNLVKLAASADVLIHSVMYPPAMDRLVARVPNAAALKASVLAHQTSAEDAGRIAQDAGVKTLGLSHFGPARRSCHDRRDIARCRAAPLPGHRDRWQGSARDLPFVSADRQLSLAKVTTLKMAVVVPAPSAIHGRRRPCLAFFVSAMPNMA